MSTKNFLAAIAIALLVFAISFPASASAQSQVLHRFSNENFGCLVTLEEDEWGEFFHHDIVRLDENDSIVRYIPFRRFAVPRRERIRFLRTRLANIERPNARQRLRQRIASIRFLIRQDARPCHNGEYGLDGPEFDPGDSNPQPTPPGNHNPGQNASACEVFGDSAGDFSADIINGEKCSIGNSSVVYLRSEKGFSCTGTVISPRAVLSAAHCFTDNNGNLNEDWVEVYVAYQEPGQKKFTSYNIKIHPSYNGSVSSVTDDSALVLLTEDLPTRTMGILKAQNLQVGEKLHIAGYGRIGNGQAVGNQFDGLQAGSMSIDTVHTGDILAKFNHPNGANTCNGDSGGPAAVFRNGKWVIGGITSYGYNANCGPTDTSGFQNVTDPSTQNFIKTHVPQLF